MNDDLSRLVPTIITISIIGVATICFFVGLLIGAAVG